MFYHFINFFSYFFLFFSFLLLPLRFSSLPFQTTAHLVGGHGNRRTRWTVEYRMPIGGPTRSSLPSNTALVGPDCEIMSPCLGSNHLFVDLLINVMYAEWMLTLGTLNAKKKTRHCRVAVVLAFLRHQTITV